MANNGEHQLVQVKERDNLGNTPLHYAIERGDKDSIKLLLTNGVNANSANKKGSTPLHYICKRERDDGLAKIFFECNDKINQPVQIDAQNKLGKTPLHLALYERNTSVAELLLRRGADTNLVDWLGFTPLHIIIKRCYIDDDLIELFFNISEKKHRLLDVNVQDYEGNTPLHLALRHGHLQLVELLLRRGSHPNVPDAQGLTPLHIMCDSHRLDYDWMKIFFEICEERKQQVQVDAVDKWGRTPLQLSVLHGCKTEMIELLLRNGANSNLVDAEGLTSLQIICQRRECNTQRERNLCMTYDDVKHIIELMLRNNANPNLANEKGSTTLHIICATYRGHNFVEIFFKVCEELNKLVQVNAQDKLGNTPLHVALERGNLKTAKLLLKKGVDLNITNAEGSTPLHVFCHRYNVKDDSIIELFFEVNEVQVDARDKEGRTPLHYAVVNFSLHVVDVLLDHGANVSSFVFPTVSQFTENYSKWLDIDTDDIKLDVRSGVLAVTERLEDKGYELNRDATLTIMKLFANNKLYEKWVDFNGYNKYWWNTTEFTSEAEKVMIISDLSLYDLIRLRPEEAEKRLTYMDYLELARSHKLQILSRKHYDACIEHLCEKLSRGVFRQWALDSFSKLIHNRLPILCCERIIDESFKNEDLWRIYLANCDLSEAERNDPLMQVFLSTVHAQYTGNHVELPRRAQSRVLRGLFRCD